jgi:hypothetical protein
MSISFFLKGDNFYRKSYKSNRLEENQQTLTQLNPNIIIKKKEEKIEKNDDITKFDFKRNRIKKKKNTR